jgi:hypothetical protein
MSNPSTPPTVWPPKPSGPVPPPIQGAGSGDIREFAVQSDWLIFLLLIVTLGLYAPFWMIRTAKVIDRTHPELRVRHGMIWGLLAYDVASLVLWLVLAGTSADTSNAAIRTGVGVFRWVGIIYNWVLVFRFRGVFNAILERTSSSLRRFGKLGTFFFGVLYLQIRLNQRIKERQADVLRLQ